MDFSVGVLGNKQIEGDWIVCNAQDKKFSVVQIDFEEENRPKNN